MATLSDGTYKITSVASPKLYLDLYKARPLGAITGLNLGGGFGQLWNVTNIGNNQIILQSYADDHTYASVYGKTEGSAIRGSPDGTIWTVEEDDSYKLKTSDADNAYVWLITGSEEGAAIVLSSPTDSDEEKWDFEKVEGSELL